jgi:hypothetical protein
MSFERDMEVYERASGIVPIFTREETSEKIALDIPLGCYDCQHDGLGSLSTGRPFWSATFTQPSADISLGFIFSLNDAFYKDGDFPAPYWTPTKGFSRTDWYSSNGVFEEQSMQYVRILRFMDTGYYQHVNTKIDLSDFLVEDHDIKITCHNNFGYRGFVLLPSNDLENWGSWSADELNEYAYASSNSFGDKESFEYSMRSHFLRLGEPGPKLTRLEPVKKSPYPMKVKVPEPVSSAWITFDSSENQEYPPNL